MEKSKWKNRFEDFEAQPDSRLEEVIFSGLKKRKRRRAIFWWSSTGLSALMLASLWIAFRQEPQPETAMKEESRAEYSERSLTDIRQKNHTREKRTPSILRKEISDVSEHALPSSSTAGKNQPAVQTGKSPLERRKVESLAKNNGKAPLLPDRNPNTGNLHDEIDGAFIIRSTSEASGILASAPPSEAGQYDAQTKNQKEPNGTAMPQDFHPGMVNKDSAGTANIQTAKRQKETAADSAVVEVAVPDSSIIKEKNFFRVDAGVGLAYACFREYTLNAKPNEMRVTNGLSRSGIQGSRLTAGGQFTFLSGRFFSVYITAQAGYFSDAFRNALTETTTGKFKGEVKGNEIQLFPVKAEYQENIRVHSVQLLSSAGLLLKAGNGWECKIGTGNRMGILTRIRRRARTDETADDWFGQGNFFVEAAASKPLQWTALAPGRYRLEVSWQKDFVSGYSWNNIGNPAYGFAEIKLIRTFGGE